MKRTSTITKKNSIYNLLEKMTLIHSIPLRNMKECRYVKFNHNDILFSYAVVNGNPYSDFVICSLGHYKISAKKRLASVYFYNRTIK